jgi:glutamyl/glutaminyl-tRNA synthetase
MLGGSGRPRFAHHPLILKAGGEKLSKSAADTGVRELRQSGLAPEEVIGRAAAAVGLVDRFRPVAARDVARLFEDRIASRESDVRGVQPGERIHRANSR